jgi:hypothetical protein
MNSVDQAPPQNKFYEAYSEVRAIVAKQVRDLNFESAEFDALWRVAVDHLKYPAEEHILSSGVVTLVEDDCMIPLKILNSFFILGEKYRGWLKVADFGIHSRQYDLSAYAMRQALRLDGRLTVKFLMRMLRLMRYTEHNLAMMWCASQLLSLGDCTDEVLQAVAQASAILPSGPAIALLGILYALNPGNLTLRFALAQLHAENGDYTLADRLLVGASAGEKSARRTLLILKLDKAAGRPTTVPEKLNSIILAKNVSAVECVELGRIIRDAYPLQAKGCFARARVLANDTSSQLEALTELANFPAPKVDQIRLPVVMISQVQRSGGSLLSQLFDGHPQILAHPHELHIGNQLKYYWPNLDLSDKPIQWLNLLFELPLVELLLKGFCKPDGNKWAAMERHRFDLDFGALANRFHNLLSARPEVSQRVVLDAYFDAFFASWKGLSRSGNERWISGFVPRLLSNFGSMELFWRDYPDGFVISLVRNPLTWYVSSQRHNAEYAKIENAIELWKMSTLSAIYQSEHNPARFHLATYEALVSDTETEMRVMARRLGIDFVPSLLEPTFMGHALLPNSSFAIKSHGVHHSSLHTDNLLSPAQRRFIELETAELYRAAVSIADAHRAEFTSEGR